MATADRVTPRPALSSGINYGPAAVAATLLVAGGILLAQEYGPWHASRFLLGASSAR